jgi:1,4-alpha-glucan branching enzyme
MQTMTSETTIPRRTPTRVKTERVERTEIVKTLKDRTPATQKGNVEEIKIDVEFKLNSNGATSVAVAGSFNDWDAKKTPLSKKGDCWTTTLKLPRGRYEYRFVVDGKWLSDPGAKESAANPFGGTNSVLSL